MKKLLIIAVLVFVTGMASAQDAEKVNRLSVMDSKVFKPDALTWKDVQILPTGAKSVVLVGDPAKAGVFILRLEFPPNYRIPPHTHPYAEFITIIAGSVGNGMGEKFDPQKGEMLKAGSAFAMPAKHAHYVWTSAEGAIVEVVGTGPWGISYINPADDPRQKAK